MPEKALNDKIFLLFSDRAGSSRALYCSPSTSSGFCGGRFRFCLTTTGCRGLQRTEAGQYHRQAVISHTRCEAVENNVN